MQVHKVYNWVGGDDWRYHIRLTNDEGQPYNIDDLTEVRWLIHNGAGEIFEHTYLMSTIASADGRLVIWIPSDETTCFPGGVYTDFVRINCNGIISTLLTGPISVTADPWRAPVTTDTLCVEKLSAVDLEERRRLRSTADIVVKLSRLERIERIPLERPADILPFHGYRPLGKTG